MVRLKELAKTVEQYREYCFNSTMVRLKECGMSGLLLLSFGFNSTMVRLKAGMKLQPEFVEWSFNSTMVRLKGDFLINMCAHFEFQFHYGTVKRRGPEFAVKHNVVFQFHYGTVKSNRATTSARFLP